MNAYELAQELQDFHGLYCEESANMLRQQADKLKKYELRNQEQIKRIADLEKTPTKYCPSENNEAYEKGFIDGMAKQRDSSVDKWVNATTPQTKPSKDEWGDSVISKKEYQQALLDTRSYLLGYADGKEARESKVRGEK
jgi:hypothetical protein